MSRNSRENVTRPLQNRYSLGLAVLVNSHDENDKWISYFMESDRWGDARVRPITNADIEGPDKVREMFRPKELPLVVGLSDIRRAIRKKDESAFRQAYEKVRPWRSALGRVTLKPIGQNWAAAEDIYARLLNSRIHQARLTVWQPEPGLLMPGLYCPDLKTANFVLLAMGRVRVCPKCKQIFVPKPDRRKQEYCIGKCEGAARRMRFYYNEREEYELAIRRGYGGTFKQWRADRAQQKSAKFHTVRGRKT